MGKNLEVIDKYLVHTCETEGFLKVTQPAVNTLDGKAEPARCITHNLRHLFSGKALGHEVGHTGAQILVILFQ